MPSPNPPGFEVASPRGKPVSTRLPTSAATPRRAGGGRRGRRGGRRPFLKLRPEGGDLVPAGGRSRSSARMRRPHHFDADQDGRPISSPLPYEAVRIYRNPAGGKANCRPSPTSHEEDFGKGPPGISPVLRHGRRDGDGAGGSSSPRRIRARVSLTRRLLEVVDQFNARDPAAERRRGP